MPGSDLDWAQSLRAACERPGETAAAWHDAGGQVVGLLGWSAPRELVIAAGMLPVRLSPGRLARLSPQGQGGGAPRPDTDAGFGRELAPATARFAAALLSGALGWIDFLVIGRDREDYTRLFYLLRELRRSGAAPGLPPVAFFDLLRLPSRTSARYNRQRAAELTDTIASWAGRPVTSADLADAVEAASVVAHSFRGIQALRARPQPAISGTEALTAAIAARVLPAARLQPLLDAALAAASPGAGDRRDADGRQGGVSGRVFLAGSAVDELTVYQVLEDLGLAVVGEDHEWGDDGSEYPLVTRDPLDGIVDRYQFAHGGAARAGLRDRVRCTAGRVRAVSADGVLYLLGPHDEAARWELPALREQLGGGLPLIPVHLRDPAADHPAQRDPAQRDRVPGTLGAGDGSPPEVREAGRRLRAELCVASGSGKAGHG